MKITSKHVGLWSFNAKEKLRRLAALRIQSEFPLVFGLKEKYF